MDTTDITCLVAQAKSKLLANGFYADDKILVYLAMCAELDGTWKKLVKDATETELKGLGRPEPRPHVVPSAVSEIPGAKAEPDCQTASHLTSSETAEHRLEYSRPTGTPASIPWQQDKVLAQLADHLVKQGMQQHSPDVALAELQLLVLSEFKRRQCVVQQDREERAQRVTLKRKLLLSFRKKRTTIQELTSLYSQLIYFVCIASGMDAALHDSMAEQEVRALVESVFPFALLAQFITLPVVDKELQLHELPYIATGIYMFNRAKGAAVAVPLQAALDEHGLDADSALGACQAAVDDVDAWMRRAVAEHVVAGTQVEAMQYTTQLLVYFQLWVYLRQMEVALATSKDAIASMQAQITRLLADAEAHLLVSASAPKQVILPLFYQAGQIFQALLEEKRMLKTSCTVLQALLGRKEREMKSCHLTFTHAMQCAINTLACTGPDVLLGLQSQADDDATCNELTLDCNSERPTLQLEGADPVIFARHNLLIPSNPHIAIVEYPQASGKWYAFSSQPSLDTFKGSPLGYIKAAREALVARPCLYALFSNLIGELPDFASKVAALDCNSIRCDLATQTSTHAVEKHIDGSYEWNAWSLRRHTLRLASLKSKLTKSSQTVSRTFRRDNDTQCWEPCTSTTQTSVHKAQRMSKKLRVLTGLRGNPSTMQMAVLNLELDLGNSKQ